MTKQELIERIYENVSRTSGSRTRNATVDLTKKAVLQVVEAMFDELGDYFIKSRVTRSSAPKFTYPGFGTFTKRRRAARDVRNLQTGEKITIGFSGVPSANR